MRLISIATSGTRSCVPGLAILLLLGQAVPLTASETLADGPSTDEMIAKAREYLGGDEALDAVESIYYRGTFETGEGIEGEVEIIFKKPLFQRVETVREEVREVTGLNHYDGWRKITERDDDSNWTVVFLEADQIRELQANTWENLNFFKNIERRRGRIENHGLTELDGESCVHLTFHHPGGIRFDRYFDAETGQLLTTEASTGGRIIEEGSQRVDGIRFPERITMIRDGEVTNRIQFDEIDVNREIDEDLFEVPSMAPGRSGGPPIQGDEDLLEIPSPGGP